MNITKNEFNNYNKTLNMFENNKLNEIINKND